MKKIFIFLFVLSLGSTWSFAQTATTTTNTTDAPKVKDNGYGHRVNFGFTFAPTIDWMYPKTEGTEMNGCGVGMRYGINLNINLTEKKNFYVSTGVFIEHLKGALKFTDILSFPLPNNTYFLDTTEISRVYRPMYLTIPIGLTLKTNSMKDFFIVGNLGFYNSFLLNATNADVYTFNNTLDGTTEYWSRSEVKSTEGALMKESVYAGLGVEYSITKNFRAGLTLNYVHSLTNYFKGNGKAQNNYSHLDQKAKFGYMEIALNINFL